MMILAINTALPVMSVALSSDSDIVYETSETAPGSHCEKIIIVIHDLLKRCSAHIKQVGCIACAVGPGSYTGLRIGIAAAMGLALPNRTPTMAISTLEAVAYPYLNGDLPVCPVIDAKMGQIYTALYGENGAEIKVLKEERAVAPEIFLPSLKGEILFAGEDVRAFKQLIITQAAISARFLENSYCVASAAAKIAAGRIEKSGETCYTELIPRYLRKSAAEIKREKSGSN
ncbi:MAG: tRNA (adenosine(37)-N6)-threonylcarbamoyltransferase complex dimerization subunit type 1 TsaB [bacterium]